MTHRALVVGAGNAGKAHAEALKSIGFDVVGPLCGTATVADIALLRDPAGAVGLARPDELIRWLAVAGIALTAINMFGGFAVTQRMLQMFRK